MTSISTRRGDAGQTSLIGGSRVSKSSLRVDAYGTIDELNSAIGFARSICEEAEVNDIAKAIQRQLFVVAASLATPPDSQPRSAEISPQMVDSLTAHVHRIEKTEGIFFDWALPGEHQASAAFDIARTVCRRAERLIVHLIELGEPVDSNILPYMNRLSDLLWLLGRLIELHSGVNGRLREQTG
jgi:cob(I)alamin adenosyltransferase